MKLVTFLALISLFCAVQNAQVKTTSVQITLHTQIPATIHVSGQSHSMVDILHSIFDNKFHVDGKQYEKTQFLQLLGGIDRNIKINLNNAPYSLVEILQALTEHPGDEIVLEDGLSFRREYIQHLLQIVQSGVMVQSQTQVVPIDMVEAIIALLRADARSSSIIVNGLLIPRETLVQMLIPMIGDIHIEYDGSQINLAHFITTYVHTGVTTIPIEFLIYNIQQQVTIHNQAIDVQSSFTEKPPTIEEFLEYEVLIWKIHSKRFQAAGDQKIYLNNVKFTVAELLELLLVADIKDDYVAVKGQNIAVSNIIQELETAFEAVQIASWMNVQELLREIEVKNLTEKYLGILTLILGRQVLNYPKDDVHLGLIKGIFLNGRLMNPVQIVKAIINSNERTKILFFDEGAYIRDDLKKLLSSLGTHAYFEFQDQKYYFKTILDQHSASDKQNIDNLRKTLLFVDMDKANMYIRVKHQIIYIPELIDILSEEHGSSVVIAGTSLSRNMLIDELHKNLEGTVVMLPSGWYNVGDEVSKMKNQQFDSTTLKVFVQTLASEGDDQKQIFINDRKFDLMEILYLILSPNDAYVHLDGIRMAIDDLVDILMRVDAQYPIKLVIHGDVMTFQEVIVKVKNSENKTITSHTVVINDHRVYVEEFLQYLMFSTTKPRDYLVGTQPMDLLLILNVIYESVDVSPELIRILKLYEATESIIEIQTIKQHLLQFIIPIPVVEEIEPEHVYEIVIDGKTHSLIEVLYAVLNSKEENVYLDTSTVNRELLIQALRKVPGLITVYLNGIEMDIFEAIQYVEDIDHIPEKLHEYIVINGQRVSLDDSLKQLLFTTQKTTQIKVENAEIELKVFVQALADTNRFQDLVLLLKQYTHVETQQELYDIQLEILQYVTPPILTQYLSLDTPAVTFAVKVHGRDFDLMKVLFVLFSKKGEQVMLDDMSVQRHELLDHLKQFANEVEVVIDGQKLDILLGIELLQKLEEIPERELHLVEIDEIEYRLDYVLKVLLFTPGNPSKILLNGLFVPVDTVIEALHDSEHVKSELVDLMHLYTKTKDATSRLEIKLKIMQGLIPMLQDFIEFTQKKYYIDLKINNEPANLREIVSLIVMAANDKAYLWVNNIYVDNIFIPTIPCQK